MYMYILCVCVNIILTGACVHVHVINTFLLVFIIAINLSHLHFLIFVYYYSANTTDEGKDWIDFKVQ